MRKKIVGKDVLFGLFCGINSNDCSYLLSDLSYCKDSDGSEVLYSYNFELTYYPSDCILLLTHFKRVPLVCDITEKVATVTRIYSFDGTKLKFISNKVF